MIVQLSCLVKPGTSFLTVGEESLARRRFAEELARFRAMGYSPVEATPQIVAPCRGAVEILPS